MDGLSVGGGLIYQSHLYNNYTAPSATAIRWAASCAFPRRWNWTRSPPTSLTGVFNVADRLYYSQSFGNRATPAPGRTVVFAIEAAL